MKTITLEEMYHFLGICLKMSIDNQATGGYASYFQEKLEIAAAFNVNIEVTGRVGWAVKYMTINRYKYIRSAFHPEIGTSIVQDKCHQLRAAIKQLNRAAKTSFKPGPRMSFDKGGVMMQLRFCPVRIYNKEKPDKYRVDFLCSLKLTSNLSIILMSTRGRMMQTSKSTSTPKAFQQPRRRLSMQYALPAFPPIQKDTENYLLTTGTCAPSLPSSSRTFTCGCLQELFARIVRDGRKTCWAF